MKLYKLRISIFLCSTHAIFLTRGTDFSRLSHHYQSLFLHKIEVIMSDSDTASETDDRTAEEVAFAASETRRIISILQNQVRRAECGCIVQIAKESILEPESCQLMSSDWIYGVITNLVDSCEYTGSVAYQVDWATAHFSTHNSFLSLVAPVFEHDFTVMKFSEEGHDDNDDIELRRQFGKVNGEWIVVDYKGFFCEFCEGTQCDRAQFADELDGFLEEVKQMSLPSNQSRYKMYRWSTNMKYGSLGTGVRKEVDECVQDFIMQEFPVEKGMRRTGFIGIGSDKS